MTRLFALCALALLLTTSIVAQDGRKTGPGAPAPHDYIIVCADSLHESAQEWAAYRKENGRNPKVVTMAEIAKAAEVEVAGLNEIKSWLGGAAKAVNEPLVNFQVLLIGDCPDEGKATHDPKTEIPWFLTRQEDSNPDPKRRKRVVTDNFLADIDNDENNLPEFAIGRIPARNNEQVRLALRKVKAYESAPQGEWLRNLTFFAGEGRFGEMVDRMLEGLFTRFAEQTIDPKYTVRMTYANINSSYAYVPRMFSDKVIEEANPGSLMLVYMGHGSYDRLDNMHVGDTRYPILLGDDVPKFDIKDGKLPVMLIVACQTGYMDHPKGSLCERICFAENAPVAIVASSRDSHPYSNTLLQKALCGEVIANRRTTLGEAFVRAKRELVLAEDPDRSQLEFMARLVIPKKDERDALNRSHVSMYNLTGDPGLRLRYPGLEPKPMAPASVNDKGVIHVKVRAPKSGADGKDLVWDCTVEVLRSKIPGELKAFNAADLTSGDAAKVKAAEEAIRANHAVSNNKVVSALKLKHIGSSKGDGEIEQHFEGKADSALAPGDYILKLSARDSEGKAYGFTSVPLKIEK
ncbi:MAG: hypothetical protein KF696_11505 [Planctomycetes bacterium]|nr:hypothetical protein [Planctomycetota bacterium]MCW8135220.1 hypothetical protein [Planctomycetota bacterium]